jgi:ABC-type phosphate transport system auxiliary subunit
MKPSIPTLVTLGLLVVVALQGISTLWMTAHHNVQLKAQAEVFNSQLKAQTEVHNAQLVAQSEAHIAQLKAQAERHNAQLMAQAAQSLKK